MSTQPIGIHNPEKLGNNFQGYADVMLERILHAQEELRTSEARNMDAQAEGKRNNLDQLMGEYAEFCEKHGLHNDLEQTVN